MPMGKTSTLIYLYENLNVENEEMCKLIDFSFDEFSEILNELSITSISPSEEVIDKVLNFAAGYI